MGEETLHQPHDKLFRHAMSSLLVARQFIERWLPKAFVAMVDWSSLRVENLSGIGENLAERRQDVLYRLELAGRPVEIFLLFEHQSEPARAILGALRGERAGGLGVEEVRALIAEIFAEPQRAEALKLANHIWTYLLYHSELKSSDVREIVDSTIPPETRRDFMSTAEFLKQEGMQEGLEQGIQQGIQQGIHHGLEQGLSKGVVAGQIRALQEVLGESPTPLDVLKALPLAELEAQLLEIRTKLQRCLKDNG